MMFKPLKAEIPSHSTLNEVAMVQSHDLLISMLAEQRRTNELLAALVDALADDAGESDDDIDTGVYLDGLPRG